MTALVTTNLPLMAGAPDGMKKLRAFILELAVRGKLVPQDSSDEPSLEILNRAELALTGRDVKRKTKGLPPESEDADPPYEVPRGWAWSRLGNIAEVIRGVTYSKSDAHEQPGPNLIPLLRGNNISDGKLNFDGPVFVPSSLVSADQYIRAGDLVIAMSSGSADLVGKAAQAEQDFHGAFGAFCGVVRPAISDFFPYFGFFFQTPFYRSNAAGRGKGIGINNLQKTALQSMYVPIPPLAEQHRIVAKVDELMALCDRLEADQANAEAAHAQLVQALLDSLTQATDAADFRANWQRLSEHFHTLFTTEASIDALKQAVLQLAVMGTLVPQLAADLPAQDFLKCNKVAADEHPNLVGWATAQLGALGSVLGGATPSKANASYWIGDIPWVSPKDMKRPVIDDAEDHVSHAALEGSSLKAIPPRSILMVVRGMILAHSFPVAVTARMVTINQDMKALVPPPEIADYLLMFLQASKPAMVALVDRSSHGTCKLISEKLWSFKVSLPPLAEQHRIVAKVDELMALCDRLKAHLAEARQQHAQLATVLVEQAIAA